MSWLASLSNRAISHILVHSPWGIFLQISVPHFDYSKRCCCPSFSQNEGKDRSQNVANPLLSPNELNLTYSKLSIVRTVNKPTVASPIILTKHDWIVYLDINDHWGMENSRITRMNNY